MGILDLPAPLFAWFDDLLGQVLPPTVRLILWGIAGAVLSMALYRRISPQRRIGEVKSDLAKARRELNEYDGEFEHAWPLMGRMLKLSLRQIKIVLGPAVIASLPVLCLIIWMSTAYGHAFPAWGSDVSIRTAPTPLEARWIEEAGGSAQPASPSAAPRIVVIDNVGGILSDVSLTAPVTTVHKRQWWNALIGNPAGYLPENIGLDRIDVDLPRREYLPFGPAWIRSWEITFFAVLVLCSLAIKVVLRVE